LYIIDDLKTSQLLYNESRLEFSKTELINCEGSLTNLRPQSKKNIQNVTSD